MSFNELAKGLRNLQHNYISTTTDPSITPLIRRLVLKFLPSVPDNEIIGSYLTCGCCGELVLSLKRARQMAMETDTVEEWCALLKAETQYEEN